MSKPRILCVCAGGNVRSGSLAFVLKESGADALTLGLERNSEETARMLTGWAELIWVAEESMVECIPEADRHKVVRGFHVGADRWGYSCHPELWEMVNQIVNAWKRGNDSTGNAVA